MLWKGKNNMEKFQGKKLTAILNKELDYLGKMRLKKHIWAWSWKSLVDNISNTELHWIIIKIIGFKQDMVFINLHVTGPEQKYNSRVIALHMVN